MKNFCFQHYLSIGVDDKTVCNSQALSMAVQFLHNKRADFSFAIHFPKMEPKEASGKVSGERTWLPNLGHLLRVFASDTFLQMIVSHKSELAAMGLTLLHDVEHIPDFKKMVFVYGLRHRQKKEPIKAYANFMSHRLSRDLSPDQEAGSCPSFDAKTVTVGTPGWKPRVSGRNPYIQLESNSSGRRFSFVLYEENTCDSEQEDYKWNTYGLSSPNRKGAVPVW